MNGEDMWEVDVPIEHREDKNRTGIHVFTGLAQNKNDALASARRVYDEARAHQQEGRDIPFPEQLRWDWAARGTRPDWELRWERAKAQQILT
ncbi:hypothetical protein [Streptomyces mirabilis]|uniref:hypothetical protein n=1 Tax=Streptomyces mirabilis TaxID=68239 RepID=UPI0036B2D7D1